MNKITSVRFPDTYQGKIPSEFFEINPDAKILFISDGQYIEPGTPFPKDKNFLLLFPANYVRSVGVSASNLAIAMCADPFYDGHRNVKLINHYFTVGISCPDYVLLWKRDHNEFASLNETVTTTWSQGFQDNSHSIKHFNSNKVISIEEDPLADIWFMALKKVNGTFSLDMSIRSLQQFFAVQQKPVQEVKEIEVTKDDDDDDREVYLTTEGLNDILRAGEKETNKIILQKSRELAVRIVAEIDRVSRLVDKSKYSGFGDLSDKHRVYIVAENCEPLLPTLAKMLPALEIKIGTKCVSAYYPMAPATVCTL